MSQIPVEVTTALQKLRDAGYRAVVAGGAARDLLHGLVPKDWDIWVYDVSGELNQRAAVGEVNALVFAGDGDMSESYSDAESVVDWVLQFDGAGVAIDVCKLRPEVRGVADVVMYFDCTLNTAWLDENMEHPTKSYLYPEYGGTVLPLPYVRNWEKRKAKLTPRYSKWYKFQ